jgi:hypothetical protein
MATMMTGQGTKTNDEDNHHKTMTGMKTEMHNDMTKMTVVAAHDKGDNEDGTRTEGACNRYTGSTIQPTQKMAQEMSLASLGL